MAVVVQTVILILFSCFSESSQQVEQTQQTHPSEICLWIVALETDFTPLLRDPRSERCVRTQLLP